MNNYSTFSLSLEEKFPEWVNSPLYIKEEKEDPFLYLGSLTRYVANVAKQNLNDNNNIIIRYFNFINSKYNKSDNEINNVILLGGVDEILEDKDFLKIASDYLSGDIKKFIEEKHENKYDTNRISKVSS